MSSGRAIRLATRGDTTMPAAIPVPEHDPSLERFTFQDRPWQDSVAWHVAVDDAGATVLLRPSAPRPAGLVITVCIFMAAGSGFAYLLYRLEGVPRFVPLVPLLVMAGTSALHVGLARWAYRRSAAGHPLFALHRADGVVRLGRDDVAIGDVVALQYLSGWATWPGRTAWLAELNLIVRRGGGAVRYPLLSTNRLGEVGRVARDLAAATGVPLRTVRTGWRTPQRFRVTDRTGPDVVRPGAAGV